MKRVVVFDSGYGGEFFADRLESNLPIVEVTRVIAWRDADIFINQPRKARRIAIEALKPYIGKVDLIIIANHLLSATSLKFFRRKYKTQQFVGLSFKYPDTFIKKEVILLTTKALTRTASYFNYIFRLGRKHHTILLDTWPTKIDDGVLTKDEIAATIKSSLQSKIPEEIVLACSQFDDIKTNLRQIFGRNLKIYDGFDDTIREAIKVLHLRGGVCKCR